MTPPHAIILRGDLRIRGDQRIELENMMISRQYRLNPLKVHGRSRQCILDSFLGRLRIGTIASVICLLIKGIDVPSSKHSPKQPVISQTFALS